MQMLASIIAGVGIFILGQIFQQFILMPLQEFSRQRADAIYFIVRFKDLTNSSLVWDAEEKRNVKQMKAALAYSVELIPFYDALASARIFGLPKRLNVHAAAKKIGILADFVNSKSGTIAPRDIDVAQEIATLLRAKISLAKM